MEESVNNEIRENKAPILVKTKTWGKNIVTYDIQNPNREGIGFLELVYNPRLKECTLGVIIINEREKGKGYGRAVYGQIPNLPPPIEGEFHFVSDVPQNVTEDAKNVWEYFVKEGKAILREDGRYQMLKTNPSNP